MSMFTDRLDELKKPGNQPDPASTAKYTVPSGWEPGIKYESDGKMTVTTSAVSAMESPSQWADLVESLGQQIPNGWKVVLKEAKFDPATWVKNPDGSTTTTPIWRYRFGIEPTASSVNVDDLLDMVSKPRKTPLKAVENASAFGLVVSDMQWGKMDCGGSEAALRTWLESSDLAVQQYKKDIQAKMVSESVIFLPGDCIEGTQSGANRLRRLDLTLTEQMRVYRKTLLDLVKRMADFGPKVTVVVVPGNHDEAIRTGGDLNTTYDDSWAIEGAAQVADALKESEKYDNVAFVFPKTDTLTVTINVSGTVVGMLHGHQAKGKMDTWLANQALGRNPIGTADLVISGHYHHLAVKHMGPTTWLQAPALESGSQWYENSAGVAAPRGMVSLHIGNGSWNTLRVHGPALTR